MQVFLFNGVLEVKVAETVFMGLLFPERLMLNEAPTAANSKHALSLARRKIWKG